MEARSEQAVHLIAQMCSTMHPYDTVRLAVLAAKDPAFAMIVIVFKDQPALWPRLLQANTGNSHLTSQFKNLIVNRL